LRIGMSHPEYPQLLTQFWAKVAEIFAARDGLGKAITPVLQWINSKRKNDMSFYCPIPTGIFAADGIPGSPGRRMAQNDA